MWVAETDSLLPLKAACSFPKVVQVGGRGQNKEDCPPPPSQQLLKQLWQVEG